MVQQLLYLLCIGSTGVWGGEGAERVAGGVLASPSLSEIGPEPRRTHPRMPVSLEAVWTAGREVERGAEKIRTEEQAERDRRWGSDKMGNTASSQHVPDKYVQR